MHLLILIAKLIGLYLLTFIIGFIWFWGWGRWDEYSEKPKNRFAGMVRDKQIGSSLFMGAIFILFCAWRVIDSTIRLITRQSRANSAKI